jgi:O-antigen/teichoic acid export membrane protein
MAGAALPALSKSWKISLQSFKNVHQKSVKYLLLLATPLAVGTFILGERVVVLLFGQDYLPSVTVIKVLTLSLLPDFMNYIMSATLISMNRQRVIVGAALVGMVAALGSCFIFIPLWGAAGAAVSFVISTSAVFIFQFCALFRQFWIITTFVTSARAAVAGAIMGLMLVWFVTVGLSLPLLVSLSVIVYSGALLLLKEVKWHEVKLGYELLRDLCKSTFTSGVSREKA